MMLPDGKAADVKEVRSFVRNGAARITPTKTLG
jgi:hypothetical protein